LSVMWTGAPDCPVCHQTVYGVPPDSVRCARTLQGQPATLGKSQVRSAIIHRTVRCATRLFGEPADNSYLHAMVDYAK
jgi:hypothetical protein